MGGRNKEKEKEQGGQEERRKERASEKEARWGACCREKLKVTLGPLKEPQRREEKIRSTILVIFQATLLHHTRRARISYLLFFFA